MANAILINIIIILGSIALILLIILSALVMLLVFEMIRIIKGARKFLRQVDLKALSIISSLLHFMRGGVYGKKR